jgi:hypothetical protein
MAFKYTPETGLNNTTSYPTVPANETAARQQFTDLFGQIRDYVNIYDNYAVDAGAANAYVVTLDPAPTAYTAGMTIAFKAVNANTGASTVNANGLGVKTLKKKGNTDLSSGDIPAGMIVVVIYDGTNFQTDLGLISHVADLTPHASATNLINTSGGQIISGTLNLSKSAPTGGTNMLVVGNASAGTVASPNFMGIELRGFASTVKAKIMALEQSNNTNSSDIVISTNNSGVIAEKLRISEAGTLTATGNLIALNIKRGTGSPEGAITGVVGDLYLRTDDGASTTLYVKGSGTGNTGWVAK